MGIKLTIVEPQFVPVLESLGLRCYADYISCRLGEMLARSGTTETLRIPACGPACPDALYLKRYRYAGAQWRHGFRRDKASIEARNYRILREECTVCVPDVIAYGSRRRGWRLSDAFILARGIPGAVPLDEFVAAQWPDPRAAGDDELRQYLLSETACLVAQMHAAGFYHVDLQWRNLLVVEGGSAQPRICVIDSSRGGLRACRVYAAHGQLRDLSSLAKQAMISMTARERTRWLRCYFGVARLTREHHAIVWTILRDRGAKDTYPTA
ncbi:MAG TPA: lipopolysaccharide kinase InaA family protein [Phycisphaerae bacterium]|nr:lipopolysaccharide kinase InaA family protein [Phycisphaerae bacterium]